MAQGKKEVPGFFEKRELLYAAQPEVAALRRRAAACLAEGLLDTALELSQKAGDGAGAEQVLAAARRAGDVFSFDAALRALDRTAAPGEWVRLGETALGEGRLSFAYRAFEKADHQPGLEKTRAAMAAAGLLPPQGR